MFANELNNSVGKRTTNKSLAVTLEMLVKATEKLSDTLLTVADNPVHSIKGEAGLQTYADKGA